MCEGSNKGIIIVSSLLLITIVCQIVGFSTPYWLDTGNSTQGLFSVCGNVPVSDDRCYSITLNDEPDWLQSVIGLEAVAMVCQLLAASSVFWFHKNESRDYAKCGVFFLLVAGISGIIGTCVYGIKITIDNPPKYLSWSYYLEVIAGILCFAVAGLLSLAFNALSGYSQI